MSFAGRRHLWGPALALLLSPVVLAVVPYTAATAHAAASLDGPTGAVWQLVPPMAGQSAEYGSLLLHDPVTQRLLVFPNQQTGCFWSLDLGSAAGWAPEQFGAQPPSNWNQAIQAFYDLIAHRYVVIPDVASMRIDPSVWILQTGEAPTVSSLTPSGDPPPFGIWGGAATYDAVRRRVIFYLPIIEAPNGTPVANPEPVWFLELAPEASWKRGPSQTGIPPWRYGGLLAFDEAALAILVYGGHVYDSSADQWETMTELWTLDLSTGAWSEIASVGTPPTLPIRSASRIRQKAWFDSASRTLLVVQPPGDVHTLTVGAAPTWRRSPWPSTVERVDYPNAVLDQDGRRLILTTGMRVGNTTVPQWSNSVWAFHVDRPQESAWETLSANDPTLGRGGLTLEPLSDQLIVSGQYAFSPASRPAYRRIAENRFIRGLDFPRELLVDTSRERLVSVEAGNAISTLSLRGDSLWRPLSVEGSYPTNWRLSNGAVLMDLRRDRALVLDFATGDLWELQFSPTTQWRLRSSAMAPILGRHDQAVVYDATRDAILMGGGYRTGPEYLHDLWMLPLNGDLNWQRLVDRPDFPTLMGLVNRSQGRLLGLAEGFQDNLILYDVQLAEPVVATQIAILDSPCPPNLTEPNQDTYAYDPGRDRLWGPQYDGQLWSLLLDASAGADAVIRAVTPRFVGQLDTPLRIDGVGMHDIAAAELRRIGVSPIVATAIEVVSPGIRLRAHFPLSSAALGDWDLVLVRGNGSTLTLPHGVSVVRTAPNIIVESAWPARVRSGTPSLLTFFVRNDGTGPARGRLDVTSEADIVWTSVQGGEATNGHGGSLFRSPTLAVLPGGTVSFSVRATFPVEANGIKVPAAVLWVVEP